MGKVLFIDNKEIKLSKNVYSVVCRIANTLGVKVEDLIRNYIKHYDELEKVPMVNYLLKKRREAKYCSSCGRDISSELAFGNERRPLCLECYTKELARTLRIEETPLGVDEEI